MRTGWMLCWHSDATCCICSETDMLEIIGRMGSNVIIFFKKMKYSEVWHEFNRNNNCEAENTTAIPKK